MACESAVHLEERALPVKGFSSMLSDLERGAELVGRMPAEERKALNYGADLFGRLASALITAGRAEEARDACRRLGHV